MPPPSCVPSQNCLLNALCAEELERIIPHLELVQLSLGEVLYEAGEKLHHAYFPVDFIISILYLTESGASAEIAVVGFEGMVCVSLHDRSNHAKSGRRAERRLFVPHPAKTLYAGI